ncbi:hypothetical protein D3C86_1513240 [compost metagenome]
MNSRGFNDICFQNDFPAIHCAVFLNRPKTNLGSWLGILRYGTDNYPVRARCDVTVVIDFNIKRGVFF